jgi:hypothetical protein
MAGCRFAFSNAGQEYISDEIRMALPIRLPADPHGSIRPSLASTRCIAREPEPILFNICIASPLEGCSIDLLQ